MKWPKARIHIYSWLTETTIQIKFIFILFYWENENFLSVAVRMWYRPEKENGEVIDWEHFNGTLNINVS